MTIEELHQKIRDCNIRLQALDKSYYLGTVKGDKCQKDLAILKQDLENLMKEAIELDLTKEISVIATLIVLCTFH